MSKEIKFRVWDIIKKVFIPIETYALVQVDFKAFAVMIKDWEEYLQGEYFYPEYQIISFFTGLKDINGIDIYCGDILKWIGTTDKNNGIEFNNQVYFLDYRFRIKGTKNKKTFHCDFNPNQIFNHKCEVIGNIHTNPELLK